MSNLPQGPVQSCRLDKGKLASIWWSSYGGESSLRHLDFALTCDPSFLQIDAWPTLSVFAQEITVSVKKYSGFQNQGFFTCPIQALIVPRRGKVIEKKQQIW